MFAHIHGEKELQPPETKDPNKIRIRKYYNPIQPNQFLNEENQKLVLQMTTPEKNGWSLASSLSIGIQMLSFDHYRPDSNVYDTTGDILVSMDQSPYFRKRLVETLIRQRQGLVIGMMGMKTLLKPTTKNPQESPKTPESKSTDGSSDTSKLDEEKKEDNKIPEKELNQLIEEEAEVALKLGEYINMFTIRYQGKMEEPYMENINSLGFKDFEATKIVRGDPIDLKTIISKNPDGILEWVKQVFAENGLEFDESRRFLVLNLLQKFDFNLDKLARVLQSAMDAWKEKNKSDGKSENIRDINEFITEKSNE